MTVRTWLRRWRDARTLEKRAIPDALWRLTLARFPFLAYRSDTDVERLRNMATLFLARKEFTGAHGLTVDDAMAVAIAAQACVPVLGASSRAIPKRWPRQALLSVMPFAHS